MRITPLILITPAILSIAQAQNEPARAQPAPAPPLAAPAAQASQQMDVVVKAVDDWMWYQKLGDIAEVDKIRYTSLPPAHVTNRTAPGATNPVIVHSYTFIPKKLDRTKKHPLIVLIHGGVHANFSTEAAHVVRELVEQGYSIISTDYRGSTGYGQGFYQLIDYGGREVDDVYI